MTGPVERMDWNATFRRRRLLTAAGALGAALALRRVRGAVARLPSDGEHTGTRRAAVRQETRAAQEAPVFADVAWVNADEALLFLAGRHARYPGSNLDSIMGFSAADILETMDTVVLDDVHARHGWDAVVTLYYLMARHLLEALLAVYGGGPMVLALDAGHGGRRDVFFDPGSNGTEFAHNRQMVAAAEDLAADPRYGSIIIRRIFNDEIGDDFGLSPPQDRKSAAALTIRNVRAAMLAQEAAAWNSAHPDAPVVVHVVSVHFNAGSGGTLVLHQGNAVPSLFRERSVAYARSYVATVRPALNATGLLPYQLGPALGTGLSDDRLLYEPPAYIGINPYTGVDRSKLPRRYAMLQASLLQRDYADGALRYRGLT